MQAIHLRVDCQKQMLRSPITCISYIPPSYLNNFINFFWIEPSRVFPMPCMIPSLIICEDLLVIADTPPIKANKLDIHLLHNMINIPSSTCRSTSIYKYIHKALNNSVLIPLSYLTKNRLDRGLLTDWLVIIALVIIVLSKIRWESWTNLSTDSSNSHSSLSVLPLQSYQQSTSMVTSPLLLKSGMTRSHSLIHGLLKFNLSRINKSPMSS